MEKYLYLRKILDFNLKAFVLELRIWIMLNFTGFELEIFRTTIYIYTH